MTDHDDSVKGLRRRRQMGLSGHLRELRKRLAYSAGAILLGTIIGWVLNDLLVWQELQKPLINGANGSHSEIVFPYLSSAFDLRLQISISLGVIISSPVWLYQLFAFFVPALNKRERRYTFGFFMSAIPLFLAGCCTGWLILPNIVHLLTSLVPVGASSLLTAKEYVDFVTKLVLVIGVAFVLPVFIVILNMMTILSAKGIIKAWRVAILLITLFTAAATPAADILSMFLLAIPLIILYFAAWFIAFLHDRRLAKRSLL